MLRHIFVSIGLIALSACTDEVVKNQNEADLIFSHIQSEYVLEDINGYGCSKIDASILLHVVKTGKFATEREVHDYYSYTGCSIKGKIKINNKPTTFQFDYGGIFHFGNGKMLVCGEACCVKSFNYCSWDKDGLKG